METLERNEWADVAQLVEITSDAVIICELDGTILHVNNRLLGLMCEERADVIGGDVKDVLYSSAFERATEHRLPFETDGSENELMLKLSDGSFIPVLVRAGSVTPPHIFGRRAPRCLVALHSIEEQYSHDRQLKRALSELRVANKRLSGTLSVIMSTVGSDELPTARADALTRLWGLTPEQRERFDVALNRWLRSAVRAELLAWPCVRAEVPFFSLGCEDKDIARYGAYAEGAIDALATDPADPSRALVIDYKTGGTPDETPEQLVEKHALQARVYSDVLHKAGFKTVTVKFVRVEQSDPSNPAESQVVTYNL